MGKILNKNIFLILACLVLIGVFGLFRTHPQRPHVIIMSIDTLRADHLSCYGYSRETSPHIDAFASEAVLFEKTIAPSPSTAQSHMSLFTGLTPAVHNIYNYDRDGWYHTLYEKIPTMAEILKRNGYMTIGFHGGGNIAGFLGFSRGFDSYTHDQIYWPSVFLKPDTFKQTIQEVITKSKRERKPLFLFLHHYVCHDPYIKAPEEFKLRFLDQAVPALPVLSANILEDQEYFGISEEFWKNIDMSDPRHRKHVIALYDGMVNYSDYIFQQVMDVLKNENIYDDSLIIVLSDHGEEFYEHAGIKHNNLFIETLHVPLIIRFPKAAHQGRRIKRYVSLTDVMPTLLDFLNINPGNFMQGGTLLPFLNSGEKAESQILSFKGNSSVLRFFEKGFFYTNYHLSGTGEWLFDPATDPQEQDNAMDSIDASTRNWMRNRAQEISLEQKELKSRLVVEGESLNVHDEPTLKKLHALGYL